MTFAKTSPVRVGVDSVAREQRWCVLGVARVILLAGLLWKAKRRLRAMGWYSRYLCNRAQHKGVTFPWNLWCGVAFGCVAFGWVSATWAGTVVEVQGAASQLGKKGTLLLHSLLKARGYQTGPQGRTSAQVMLLRLAKGGRVDISQEGISRRFQVPSGLNTGELRARSVVSFVEIFAEWREARPTLRVRVPPKKRKRTRPRRIRRRRVRPRRVVQVKKQVTPRHLREGWLPAVDLGAVLGLQPSLNTGVPFGLLLRIGASSQRWRLQGEMGLQWLLGSSTASISTFRPALGASWSALPHFHGLSVDIELHLMVELNWTSDFVTEAFMVRPGLRLGVRASYQLSPEWSLFVLPAFSLFTNGYQITSAGKTLFEASMWQVELQIGISFGPS